MRVLALDVGTKRIGVAVSDLTGTLARSFTVIHRRGLAEDLAAIEKILREEEAELVVVGLPISLSGEIGPQARIVLEFITDLERWLDVPVVTWDERFTTVEAQQALRLQGVKGRKQKGRIDAAAAAFLLQSYLAAQARPEAGSRESL